MNLVKISNDINPRDNYILNALSPPEYNYISPHLEYVSLSSGEVLFEINQKVQYVYFPLTFIASLLCSLEDGTAVEIATIGNEGILGISAFLGGNGGLTEALIHKTGDGYRISTQSLQRALERSGGRRASNLHKILLRYAHSLFIQMSQTTACNRRHTLEKHLSRWLLLNFDRTSSNKIPLTQDSIGYILGVRRESITEAAKKLQNAGVIESTRGQIELIDRSKLEELTCECYGIIKSQVINSLPNN